MERLELESTEEAFIVAERAANKQSADEGTDDDLEPKDRRNRTSGVCGPNCRIKEGDDIRMYEQVDVFRVIGAARGEEWLNVLAMTPWGNYVMPIDGRDVEDRAPADPEEEPLPIWTDAAPRGARKAP